MTKSEKAKDRRLKILFRTSLEEYLKIENKQKSSQFVLLMGKRNGLDHDHDSGLVRGILEWRLNKALGLIEKVSKKHAPSLLRALADFLEDPPAVEVIGRRYGLIGLAKVKKKMVYGPPEGE